jgi:endoglucanase
MMRALALLLLLAAAPAHAGTPPSAASGGPPVTRLALLRRGISFTNWFRFPFRQDAAYLSLYLAPAALREIAGWGFTFARLAVQPHLLERADGGLDPARVALLIRAVREIERAGLAVVIDIQPNDWPLDRSAAARARLLRLWHDLAPHLAVLDPERTFPELLNEPVFPDTATWESLQGKLLREVRVVLPRSTIILTGADWGSLDGLLRLTPVADRDVVYSFHFYEPAVLTSLAAFEPGLDRRALARLPFPVSAPGCAAAADVSTQERTRAVIRFYCAGGWDAAMITKRIDEAAAWGQAHGVPVLMGEFGASDALDPSARRAWLAAVRGAAEADGIGWALWGYEDPMGLGIPRARTGPDPAILRALGLPGVSAPAR